MKNSAIEKDRSLVTPAKRYLVPVAAVAATAVLAGALFTNSVVMARPAPESVADVAAKVTPAVVNVSAVRATNASHAMDGRHEMPFPPGSPFEEYFKRFFGDQWPGARPGPPNRPDQPAAAMGSGFIIDPAGYVVTNNHVIANAREIKVTLKQDQTYTAEVIGRDEKTDLALLKVDAGKPLPSVRFGDSDGMRPGDWVMAVGNPFGLGGSVTAGIVSARGRDLGGNTLVDFLQIDAPINRGNSGGPSFDADGDVIGVNTAIYSPNGGNVGIGFAIPSNLVKQVVADLRANGSVSRGWLGVQIQPVTKDIAAGFGLKEPSGALVSAVVADSPADDAGFTAGDIVLAWDGKDVIRFKDLPRLVAATRADSKAEVKVWRRGSEKSLTVTVGQLAAKVAQAPGDRHMQTGARELAGTGLVVGDLTPERRHEFGIPDDVDGVVVAEVDRDSTAAKQGLRPGDVIAFIAQEPVANAGEAAAKVEKVRKAGKPVVAVRVSRRGNDRFVVLRFASA